MEPGTEKGVQMHLTQPDVAPDYRTHRTHRTQSPHYESQDATPPHLTQDGFLLMHTYDIKGEKTIWMQASQSSGWDKRQGTIQLTIFADGVPRVKPLIFFRGKGVGQTILTEAQKYDNHVIVKFNPTAYANSENMVSWIEEQLVPILEVEPTLLALDLFAGHRTDEVLDIFKANDITISVIPGGCTGLIQPLDVSINRPFKDILKVSQLSIL